MKPDPDQSPSLPEQIPQWVQLREQLQSCGHAAAAIGKIETLITASSYALRHLLREPELAKHLLGLNGFELEDEITSLLETDKIDLDQVRRELRLYLHRC